MSVIIGIDPHKALHAAGAIDRTEVELSKLQVRTGPGSYRSCSPGQRRSSVERGRSSPLVGSAICSRRIEMRTVFATKELRDEAVERYHAIEGGQQTLSNLAAYVTEIVRKGAEG
jgi:hypothetical protein